MKKIHSALVSLVLMLGLSTGAQAANFFDMDPDTNTLAIEPLPVPSGYNFSYGESGLGSNHSVLDYWNFTVDSTASLGSSLTSISLTANGFASFATALETFVTGDGGGWTNIANGISSNLINLTSWVSVLEFTPLSPTPTEYRLVISGNANNLYNYGGNVDLMAPIPEPEIYAMMAAGLGLMGFVARRRQRNGAVA